MNERIQELARKAGMRHPVMGEIVYSSFSHEEFAELIVYDFLSELTNDDALGEARINTIKRLAEKWGVAR